MDPRYLSPFSQSSWMGMETLAGMGCFFGFRLGLGFLDKLL
jgi:hypothetical protein